MVYLVLLQLFLVCYDDRIFTIEQVLEFSEPESERCDQDERGQRGSNPSFNMCFTIEVKCSDRFSEDVKLVDEPWKSILHN